MIQQSMINISHPGPIVLFGSGETSPQGRKVYDYILRSLPSSPRIALLETPAGFELNSDRVIGRVGEFLEHRLRNYDPKIEIIPARKRGTYNSPDNPNILSPLLNADLIFMGPGSPTYAVRQLRDSLAWQMLIARHRLGAAIALASAATVAISICTLPVYEIYKVGEDLHWKEGLNFFGLYGLSLIFIPHWNNNDGGEELDTSRCFMGAPRFTKLIKMLPPDITIIGIDELTALIIEPEAGKCRVIGHGGVTLLHTGHLHADITSTGEKNLSDLDDIIEYQSGHLHTYQDGETFPLSEIGSFHPYNPEAALPGNVWSQAVDAQLIKERNNKEEDEKPPEVILSLVEERKEARTNKDWEKADDLRNQIAELGWEVIDTPEGSEINKIED